MGVLTAGEIDMYTGTWDDDATGFRLTASEICGQNAGTDQVIIQASDGKFKAGGGVVTIDEDGITIDAGGTVANRVDWTDNAAIVGQVYGRRMTGDSRIYMFMASYTEGSDTGAIALGAGDASPGNYAELLLDPITGLKFRNDLGTSNLPLVLAAGSPGIYFADSNTEIWEDAPGNLSFKDVNAGTKTLSQLAGNEVTGGAQYYNVLAGTTVNITVTYDEALSAVADAVVATINIGADVDPGLYSWYVRSHTASQCVVRVKSTSGSDTGLYVQVVAVKV